MPESVSRVASFHHVDTRPIRKGRLGRPVEFGYKAQVVDNVDGVILDHNVEVGNPADAPQLAPAIAPITARTGRTPGAVTADRGYGEASVERDLHELGVRAVATPPREQTQRRAPRVRTPASLPRKDQMADRIRRTHQPSNAAMAGTAPNSPASRAPEPVRARSLRPQPRQDRRLHSMNRYPDRPRRNPRPQSRVPRSSHHRHHQFFRSSS